MSSANTPQQVTTVQNKDPWGASQPFLGNAMQKAFELQQGNVGYQPYQGQTLADLNPYQNQGILHGLELAIANPYGSPGVQAAQGLASNVIGSQGITPGIQGAITGLQGVANRAEGEQNPYLQAILNTNNRQIADKVNATMSGAGRYGSGQHTDVLTRALAESANPILAQDYTQRQQMLGQLYGQINDIYGQGLNRAGQFSQLAPQLDQAQYMPSQMMQQLGGIYSQRAQQQLSNDINLYNAQQSYPWEQLARANAIYTGTGGLGGSQVTTSPNLNAPVGGLQGAMGGALAGGVAGTSIFGPGVGSLAGAGIGGLLGYLR